MLEAHQAADGNMVAQQEALQEKIMDIGTSIHDNWVPMKMVWQGFKMMIWPSVWYPLPVCSLTNAQATELMTSLYKFLLPKFSVVQCFPKVYRHAPRCFQSFALPEFGTEQDRVAFVTWRHGIPHRQFLAGTLEQLQLEIGIGIPVLEAPFEMYGFRSTDVWFHSLWRFVSEEDIILCKEELAVPSLQWENDEFIMEWLIQKCDWSNADIVCFNCCHIRMQVLGLTNIIHDDGITLCQRIKSPNDREIEDSKYEWAHEFPSSSDWGIW